MKETLLSQLELSPADCAALPGKVRNRILTFLSHWESHQEVIDVVEAIDRPDMVSMADRKAKAFAGMGRTPSAIKVMADRLDNKFSPTALSQLGRFYYEDKNLETPHSRNLSTNAPAHNSLNRQVKD